MWVRALNMEPKGEMTAPLYKDRSAPWMHLEGALILLILEINEQTPPHGISQALPTREQMEVIENPMPGKGQNRGKAQNM